MGLGSLRVHRAQREAAARAAVSVAASAVAPRVEPTEAELEALTAPALVVPAASPLTKPKAAKS